MMSYSGVAFGVLADARARQHRRRRLVIGCALVVAVVGALAGYEAAGNGAGPGAGAPITQDSAAFSHGTSLQLPYGRATDTFRIRAAAGRAYDATLTAPAGSAIAVTINGAGIGWTLTTLDTADCRASAGRTVCFLPFAAGGNPGGTWEAVVHKTTLPPVDARFSIIFRQHPGAYPCPRNMAVGTLWCGPRIK